MTNIERVRSHMEKLDARADTSEIVTDYAEDAVLLVAGSEQKGHEALTAAFEANYKLMGDQKFADIEVDELDDGAVECSWKLGPMTGGDKFWFDDAGLFIRQKVFVGQKPADW